MRPSFGILTGPTVQRSAIVAALCLLAAPTQAQAAQDGYCWNDKVGWISFAGVTFDASSRQLSGTATFASGDGEIDFTEQAGQAIGMTVASELSGGQYAVTGQAFSEQIGWIVADHGGTDQAAFTPEGKLTGNFWSNEFGWLNCSESDVGSANVQIIDDVVPPTVRGSAWRLFRQRTVAVTTGGASRSAGSGSLLPPPERPYAGNPGRDEPIQSPESPGPAAVATVPNEPESFLSRLLANVRSRLVARIERRIAEHPQVAAMLRRVLERMDQRFRRSIP